MRWADKLSANWQKMFAYFPHRTLEGEWVWLRSCYVRFGGYRYPYLESDPWSVYTLTPEKFPPKKK